MSQDIRSVLEANQGQTLSKALIEGLLVELHPHLVAIADQGIQEGQRRAEVQPAQTVVQDTIEDAELKERQ